MTSTLAGAQTEHYRVFKKRMARIKEEVATMYHDLPLIGLEAVERFKAVDYADDGLPELTARVSALEPSFTSSATYRANQGR